MHHLVLLLSLLCGSPVAPLSIKVGSSRPTTLRRAPSRPGGKTAWILTAAGHKKPPLPSSRPPQLQTRYDFLNSGDSRVPMVNFGTGVAQAVTSNEIRHSGDRYQPGMAEHTGGAVTYRPFEVEADRADSRGDSADDGPMSRHYLAMNIQVHTPAPEPSVQWINSADRYTSVNNVRIPNYSLGCSSGQSCSFVLSVPETGAAPARPPHNEQKVQSYLDQYEAILEQARNTTSNYLVQKLEPQKRFPSPMEAYQRDQQRPLDRPSISTAAPSGVPAGAPLPAGTSLHRPYRTMRPTFVHTSLAMSSSDRAGGAESGASGLVNVYGDQTRRVGQQQPAAITLSSQQRPQALTGRHPFDDHVPHWQGNHKKNSEYQQPIGERVPETRPGYPSLLNYDRRGYVSPYSDRDRGPVSLHLDSQSDRKRHPSFHMNYFSDRKGLVTPTRDTMQGNDASEANAAHETPAGYHHPTDDEETQNSGLTTDQRLKIHALASGYPYNEQGSGTQHPMNLGFRSPDSPDSHPDVNTPGMRVPAAETGERYSLDLYQGGRPRPGVSGYYSSITSQRPERLSRLPWDRHRSHVSSRGHTLRRGSRQMQNPPDGDRGEVRCDRKGESEQCRNARESDDSAQTLSNAEWWMRGLANAGNIGEPVFSVLNLNKLKHSLSQERSRAEKRPKAAPQRVKIFKAHLKSRPITFKDFEKPASKFETRYSGAPKNNSASITTIEGERHVPNVMARRFQLPSSGFR